MKTYARYKDSGISWIGEIPEHWDVKRTKYVVDSFCKGNGITKEEVFDDGNVKCVRYGEIYSKYENTFSDCFSRTKLETISSPQFFSNGDILFAGTGELVEEIGKNIVYLGNEKCLAGGDIVIAKHSQNPKFLNYVLNSQSSQRQKSYGKAKLKVVHISASEIGNVFIPVPPLEEQESIAAYLDKKTEQINGLVGAKQKQIELLKEYKQSLIANAVTKGINPKVKMKDSGINWIGKVPEHWEIKRIASFFDENKEVNKEFEYKHAYQFKYGTLVPKNEMGDEKEYEETYVKYTILNRNDIVFNGLNLNYDFISQRVAICPEKGIITSAYIAITPRNTIDPMFYCWLFKTMDNKKMFHGMGSGIRLTLSYAELKSQLIPFPPIDEQKQIVAYINERVSSIDSQISSIEKQIANLNEYKQSLISDVVTGKVKV